MAVPAAWKTRTFWRPRLQRLLSRILDKLGGYVPPRVPPADTQPYAIVAGF